MAEQKIVCPACGQSDFVEKASTLYLLSAGLNRRPGSKAAETPGGGATDAAKLSFELPPKAFYLLSRKLKPPSAGQPALTRNLHPDLVVVFFSAIVPFFIAGIVRTQPGALLPTLVLLACAYGVYFALRKAILRKYNAAQEARREQAEQVKRGIESWMTLYYCARDNAVFQPWEKAVTPLDDMDEYLLKGKRGKAPGAPAR